MTSKPTNSLTHIASKLESESEQSLIFERFLPATEVLEVCEVFGHHFRDRIYTPVTTLWMFLGQTLSADHSCREAVHRLNAWRVSRGRKKADSNTTSYCMARKRLPENVVKELAKRSGQKCQQHAASRWQWKGRDIKVADGFTLTMPDTTDNQEEYPQQRGQKKGCGFPMMRCVMLFCLSTGAALDIAMGPYRGKQTGENSLLQAINHLLFPGDILLADRYYATFGNIYQAIAGGYHVVMRSHHKRKIDFRRGRKQGSYDQVIAYNLIIQTSIIFKTNPKRISHKGAVQALNAFAEKLDAHNEQLETLEAAMYESIMEHPIGDRDPRVHPREIKRRQKNYKLMQKPRHAARKSTA